MEHDPWLLEQLVRERSSRLHEAIAPTLPHHLSGARTRGARRPGRLARRMGLAMIASGHRLAGLGPVPRSLRLSGLDGPRPC
ncbi:MAG TPA: hypothetical protein VE990_09535 [Acidimicrobiales bacterium]|nr:hypothetical protein [Acidimicrobiales bacterium]